MHTDEDMNMTIDDRRKYLHKMHRRYVEAGPGLRSQLLDEMEAMTGLHRKSLVRLMGDGQLVRRPRGKQRGATYGLPVTNAVRVIAESMDYICAERLQPNLIWCAERLAAHAELVVSPAVLEQLGQISVSTLRRIMSQMPREEVRLPRGGPERAQRLARDIPMRRIPWNEIEPGHFEVDLVHHGGASSGGDYVHTLQMVDVATGWSERVAVLGRSYTVMKDAFDRIDARLPFPVRELHPDNGSEFLNCHLIRYWGQALPGVRLSRSRPYHKNDNRFVEQKNATLVRAFLGTERLDSVAQTQALNALYDKMWLYYNFFQPVLRLAEKTVDRRADGSLRYHRRFDQPRTPFDRLCDAGAFADERQAAWRERRDGLNPRRLRREIYADLQALFRIPGALPGQTEDVYQTLSTPLDLDERGKHRGNIIIWLDNLAR